MVAEQKKRKAK